MRIIKMASPGLNLRNYIFIFILKSTSPLLQHLCMTHTQQWLEFQMMIWPRVYITVDTLQWLEFQILLWPRDYITVNVDNLGMLRHALNVNTETPALIRQFSATKGHSEQPSIAVRQLLRVSERASST